MTHCPICGDPMESELVCCWECYRVTDRLTPGVHLDPNGTKATPEGYAVVLTRAQVDRFDAERQARIS
jgi:hypothetical protein